MNSFEVATVSAFIGSRNTNTVKQTFTTSDALTVRIKVRAGDTNVNFTDASIELIPVFLNPA